MIYDEILWESDTYAYCLVCCRLLVVYVLTSDWCVRYCCHTMYVSHTVEQQIPVQLLYLVNQGFDLDSK